MGYNRHMNISDFYTSLFYTWEYRGRGWHVSDYTVNLEAPFIPYYRHGYPKNRADDGRRPTLLSSLFESFQTPKPVVEHQDILDYQTLEPFEYTHPFDLTALQVRFTKERRISPEKMKALLVMLSSAVVPISFEIIGTDKEIIIQFVSDEMTMDIVETYLHAFFSNCSISRSTIYLENILQESRPTAVVDFGLKHEFMRPLHMAKNYSMDPLIGVFAVLERLTFYEQVGVQILFQPTINHWGESILRSVTMHDGTSFFMDAPDAPKLAQDKIHSPFYGVTIRAFAQSVEVPKAFQLLDKISFALIHGSKGIWNELLPLSDPEYDVERRIRDICCRESHRLGMLLNVDELITLLHFPSESIISDKLFASARKTKELPSNARDKQFILGENIHNCVTTNVCYSIEDRLKHVHMIGATGTGKSTLIANLILQDIEHGVGVVLFDPHGDLVDDILLRIPPDRIPDVVLVDPSDIDYSIGLNILEAHNDVEKEVLASDLVAIFKKHATSWGDQMNAVVANAILAILESTQGGSLHDLRRFLIEKDFRTAFLKTVRDPAILYYWQKEYPILKTNSIGPILTRLNTFLRPKAIRNMVVQKEGLDFGHLLSSGKIILLKLSQGLIGIENSFLLGSLILSKLHQAILQRQHDAVRSPTFIYLDEFQHFITPSIKEMISGIRKYNVGLVLSHQDLQQLQREDGELLNAVLGNINTRIVFRVGEPDARKLQDGFSSFDHNDLQNLGKGEAIIRLEQPKYDCSLTTSRLTELDEEESDFIKECIVDFCRNRYASERSAVEEALYESFDIDTKRGQGSPIPESFPPDMPDSILHRVDCTPDVIGLGEISLKEDPRPENAHLPRNTSTHRYYQNLIKKMAESLGYTATIESLLPDGAGLVDVLLFKEDKSIAVEICHTTDAQWEMGNILKCINAGYTQIVSLSEDEKQLERIRKKCVTGIAEFKKHLVFFFTPDLFYGFLNESIKQEIPEEVHMKGYRVNVTYNAITKAEMDNKRASVTRTVVNSNRRPKKN